jgi:hypothetical protein
MTKTETWQTRPLVREGAPKRQDSNSEKKSLVKSPRLGSTPRHTDWLTVSRNVTLTWLGPGAGLKGVEYRKICCLCRKSKRCCPVRNLVTVLTDLLMPLMTIIWAYKISLDPGLEFKDERGKGTSPRVWILSLRKNIQVSVGTSHISINQHMSVAMQRLVDFISMVTQQYVTKQQSCNTLLAGFSVGRSIRDSLLLCNGWRNYAVNRTLFSGSVRNL